MKPRQHDPQYSAVLGLKQSHAVTNMPIGSFIDVQNMNLDGLGGKSQRRGYTNLFALPVQSPVQSLLDYQTTTGGQEVLAYGGSAIYSWDTAATVSVVRSSLPTDTPWQWTVYNDRVLGVNGQSTSFDYNGTTFTSISITPPSGHVTLVGDYEYVVTFYDSARAAESNPAALATAPSATTSAGNLTIQLSNLPTATAGEDVTHHRIYRKGPAETVFTRTAEISYVAGGTYTDTGDASGTIQVITDTGQQDEGNTPHPQSRIIVEYGDRIFMVSEDDPTLLIYSAAGRSYAYPSANFFPIGRKDGQRILRVEKHGKALLIHKRNGTWILTGDPTVATPERLTGTGIQDYYTSVADVDNYIVRLTPEGIDRIMPTDFSATDLRDQYIGRDIISEERLINWSDTSDIRMFNYRRQDSQHVYIFLPNTSDYSTKVLVWDYSVDQWVRYRISTDVFSVAEYDASGDKGMIFGDGYGMVWLWDQGSVDGIDLPPDEVNLTVTSATANTITDTSQSWTVNELIGLVVQGQTGAATGERARVISNTSDTITLDHNLANTPSAADTFTLGLIDAYGDEFWNSQGYQDRKKRMRWIVPYVRQTGDFTIAVSFRRDFLFPFLHTKTLSLQVTGSGSLWGSMIWGTGTWGPSTTNLQRVRFSGKYHYYSIRYRNTTAGYRFFWDGHSAKYQVLYDRSR